VSALVAALLLTAARATVPHCKSQTNTDVDWWVIYKFPVLTELPTGTAWRNGFGYAYLDSRTPGGGLVPAAPVNTSSLQDEHMALTYTLAQVSTRDTHARDAHARDTHARTRKRRRKSRRSFTLPV
jgi:hypothetical protein